MIFIAGNEPFTQGKVDYREACKGAIGKGIIVNTIHCGSESDGLNGKWKDGAMLADGEHLNIDQNRQVAHIAAPQDKEIAELGIKLNGTYIAYGLGGRAASVREEAQDSNAASASEYALLQRAVTKSSLNYRNDSWDMVDGVMNESIKLEEIKEEELPGEMQKMTQEERKAYVEAKAKERREIQSRVQELNEARKKYVAEKMKEQGKEGETLGSAAIKAVRGQAEKKNFKFGVSSNKDRKAK